MSEHGITRIRSREGFISEQFAMIDRALDETLRPHAQERLALASIKAKLEAIISECEKPENRGSMTQPRQAKLMDRVRSLALAVAQQKRKDE